MIFGKLRPNAASDKCQQEKRKTINGDDLLWAMTTLGFESYLEPLKIYLSKYREVCMHVLQKLCPLQSRLTVVVCVGLDGVACSRSKATSQTSAAKPKTRRRKRMTNWLCAQHALRLRNCVQNEVLDNTQRQAQQSNS